MLATLMFYTVRNRETEIRKRGEQRSLQALLDHIGYRTLDRNLQKQAREGACLHPNEARRVVEGLVSMADRRRYNTTDVELIMQALKELCQLHGFDFPTLPQHYTYAPVPPRVLV